MCINYENSTDDELLLLIKDLNNNALNFLLSRYKPLVGAKARMYFLIGGDNDDLIQEGMIGLFNAINNFDALQNVKFKTFAETCIENQIKSALRNSTRLKHSTLNSSIPIDESIEALSQDIDSPLNVILSKENYSSLVDAINVVLTDFEKLVLNEYLNGKNHKEISKIVNKDNKAISNCLSRIRNKVKKIGELWEI